jgi:hypothetical protein
MRRRADQLICGRLGDMDSVDVADDGWARSGLSADNIVWKKSSCGLRRQRRHDYDSRMSGRPDGKALEDDEHSRRGSEGWRVDHPPRIASGLNNARQPQCA